MASKTRRSTLTPRLISLAVASCFAGGAAFANPTGPTVVNGQVTMNQAGSLLSITNSPNSIINWQSFSIGANEITRFTQQSAASAVLNRVVGAGGAIDPSVILGALQSNGRVFLLNPSGIVFGAGSQIDVAGLVASSLNLSNADFLGGRLRFTEVAGAGSVVNQGAINAATGGQVYLVGPSVTNSGLITSPKGEVILAAGNTVELVNPGTPNLRVEISAPDNEARNLGQIVAEAGRVGIYAGLINHSGSTRVDSAVATEDGRIILKATKNTTVEAGSTLSASGPTGGQVTIQSGDTTIVQGAVSATGSEGRGGTVEVLGNLVGLDGNALVDVSGETGGGRALIGGDFQGRNPGVQNAYRTYFGPSATIRADAKGNGDGGTVIVWSDNATAAYGTISARGGAEGGDGGFVEVSSRGWLDFHAKVDTSAPKGRNGTLLLDPREVCIYNTDSGSCPGSGEGGGGFSGGMASQVFFTSNQFDDEEARIAFAGSGGLKSLLETGNNVTITTSNMSGGMGGITVSEDLDLYSSSSLFQLVSHDDVNLDGRIWNTGSGELRIYAGWDGQQHRGQRVHADSGDPGQGEHQRQRQHRHARQYVPHRREQHNRQQRQDRVRVRELRHRSQHIGPECRQCRDASRRAPLCRRGRRRRAALLASPGCLRRGRNHGQQWRHLARRQRHQRGVENHPQ
jgi:filamentous hemagglutinin family protein